MYDLQMEQSICAPFELLRLKLDASYKKLNEI